MKFPLKFLPVLFLLVYETPAIGQELSSNPLIQKTNHPIRWDRVDENVIKEAYDFFVQYSEKQIDDIVSIAHGKRNFSNTIKPFDQLYSFLSYLSNNINVVAFTSENDVTRSAANLYYEKLSSLKKNFFLNDGLYKALKVYSDKYGKTVSAAEQKFLRDMLLLFEKNGTSLPDEKREVLKSLNAKIARLETRFESNISEFKDSVLYDQEALKGIPEPILKRWVTNGSQVTVAVNNPNYVDIMAYADSEETRRAMYTHYNNRAYPQNVRVLDSLLYYRQRYAQELGLRSFAEYVLLDKMAKKTEVVWDFQQDILKKLMPIRNKEIVELTTTKRLISGTSTATLKAWDVSYYQKKLLKDKYQVTDDSIKPYFESENTLKGMFRIYETLFNITINEVKLPAWHASVRSFELLMDGKKAGTFYLDLYPRKGKYTHFVCFKLRPYFRGSKKDGSDDLLPVGTLICNFPEPKGNDPALLNYQQVTTLFHEFGHLVHILLSRYDLASQDPFQMKWDFVEAPSQFLENWCLEYDAVKIFARDYKTGKRMPEPLFNKLKNSQKDGIALFYLRQIALGMVDFTFVDRYDSIKGMDLNQVAVKHFQVLGIPFPKDNHFICSFGHLTSYSAQYYGYLWSRIIAQDMFTVFKQNGVMDPATGLRYRKEILEKGATIEETEMVRSFLGRDANSAAFLREVGAK